MQRISSEDDLSAGQQLQRKGANAFDLESVLGSDPVGWLFSGKGSSDSTHRASQKHVRPLNANTKVTCSVVFLHYIPYMSNPILHFAGGQSHWQREILKKGLRKCRVRGREGFFEHKKCLVWRLKLPLLYDKFSTNIKYKTCRVGERIIDNKY